MADNNNYHVTAMLYIDRFYAIRRDDTPDDPHRIYFNKEEAIAKTRELYPYEYVANIEEVSE